MDAFVEVALRVPPLVILDHILATNFGTKRQSHLEFMKHQVDHFLFNETIPNQSPDHSTANLTDDEIELHENDATYLTVHLNLLGNFVVAKLFSWIWIRNIWNIS